MKRNSNIVPLSRDHHFGLLCSWKIRQGLSKNIDPKRISVYLDYFWNTHLKTHFKEEEEVLFITREDALTAKALYEHRHIEHLVNRITDDPRETLLMEFSELLQEHIRFEERVLFPHFETILTEPELAEVGKQLDLIHQPQTDGYKDEFWR